MEKHRCDGKDYDRGLYGGYAESIETCLEQSDGSFIVENGDGHSSQVNFCPFCGTKAPVQMEVAEDAPTYRTHKERQELQAGFNAATRAMMDAAGKVDGK